MKINLIYSYEFNLILNKEFTNQENLKNYTSLISDRERIDRLLKFFSKNEKLIKDKLGYETLETYNCYIVRCEKFKSFSLPITIEYSILPEEMFLFMLKEIIKTTITDRFLDETQREEFINAFVTYIIINGNFDDKDFIKFLKNLHEESKNLYENYSFEKSENIKFENETMKEKISTFYN
jgi:hypothetical protein